MKTVLWRNGYSPYDAVRDMVESKYKWGSFIVQMRMKYEHEDDWKEITELLYNDGIHAHRQWEHYWWSGQQNVQLVAVAPINDLDISKEWAIME